MKDWIKQPSADVWEYVGVDGVDAGLAYGKVVKEKEGFNSGFVRNSVGKWDKLVDGETPDLWSAQKQVEYKCRGLDKESGRATWA